MSDSNQPSKASAALARIAFTTTTIGHFLLNKLAAIVLFFVALAFYQAIPPSVFDETGRRVSGGMAFSELLYVGILILGVTVVAPLVRLLVFPEASDYAEKGYLRRDLDSSIRTPNLLHYWFATGISYTLTIACAASLSY